MTLHFIIIGYFIHHLGSSLTYGFLTPSSTNVVFNLSNVSTEANNQVLPILHKPEPLLPTKELKSNRSNLANHRDYGATPRPLIYQIGSTYHIAHLSQGNQLSNFPQILFATNDLQEVFNEPLSLNNQSKFANENRSETVHRNSPTFKQNKAQHQREVLSNIQEIIDMLQHQRFLRPENWRSMAKEKVISGSWSNQSRMALSTRRGSFQLTPSSRSPLPPRLLSVGRAVSFGGQSTFVDSPNVTTSHRPDRLEFYTLLTDFTNTTGTKHRGHVSLRPGPISHTSNVPRTTIVRPVAPSVVGSSKWIVSRGVARPRTHKPRWPMVNRTNEGDLDEKKLMSHIRDVLRQFEQPKSVVGEVQAPSPGFKLEPSGLHLAEMERMLASVTPYGQRISKVSNGDIYTVAESQTREHRNSRHHRSRHSHWHNDFMLIPPYMLDTTSLLSGNHSLGLDSLDWSNIDQHLNNSKFENELQTNSSTDKNYAQQLKSYFQNLTLSLPIETTNGDMSIFTNDNFKHNWTIVQTESDKGKLDQLLLQDIIQLAKTPIDYDPGKTQLIQYPRQKLLGSEEWRRLNSANDTEWLGYFGSFNDSYLVEKSSTANLTIFSTVPPNIFNQSHSSPIKIIELPKVPIDGLMTVDDFNTPLKTRPFNLDNIGHRVKTRSRLVYIGQAHNGKLARKRFRPPSSFRQQRQRPKEIKAFR